MLLSEVCDTVTDTDLSGRSRFPFRTVWLSLSWSERAMFVCMYPARALQGCLKPPTPVHGVTGLCPSSALLPASTKTMPCMQSTWAAALSNALFALADFILCCPARCMCLGPSIPKATCLQATRPVQALSLCIHHHADSLLLCNGPNSPPIWCVLHLAMQGDWCIGAQAQSRFMSGTFLFFPSIVASEAAWFAEEGTRSVKYHKDHSYCAVEQFGSTYSSL